MTRRTAKLPRLLQILRGACLRGGRLLLSLYEPRPGRGKRRLGCGRLAVHQKDPRDARTVVSAADVRSEKAIVSYLRSKIPCRFLSEEAGELGRADAAEFRVILDPLDGSKNFLASNMGLFGICIALARPDHLEAGAIYLPFFDELVVAERGAGAFLCTRRGRLVTTLRERGGGSATHRLADARICIARGLGERASLAQAPLSRILTGCSEAVNYASCAVALMGLALGRIDGVVLPAQNVWDFAGGYVVLKECGFPFGFWRRPWCEPVGESTVVQAGPGDVFDIVAAGNPGLFRELTKALTVHRG